MTRNDSIDRLIEDYLDEYEGHTPLPDAVRDAIRAELPSTRQRPAWWARPRFFEMNNHIARNYGIAAAAVIAAAAIALNAFGGSRTGAPSATPSPSQSAEVPRLTALNAEAVLSGGSYRIDLPFNVPFQAQLPKGWSLRNLGSGAAEFGLAGTNGSPYLGFFVVQGVYVDACHPEAGTRTTRVPLSRNPIAIDDAEKLTAFLRSIHGVNAGSVTTVTIGDRAAAHFVVSNEIDAAADRCSDDPWVSLFDPLHGEPARTVGGTTQEMWVVSGTSRDWPVLIVGEVRDSAANEDQAAIDRVLASVAWANTP